MPKVSSSPEVQRRVSSLVQRVGYANAAALLGMSKSMLHRAARSGSVTRRSAEALLAKLPPEAGEKMEQTEKITERDIASFGKVLHALMAAAARLELGGSPEFTEHAEKV